MAPRYTHRPYGGSWVVRDGETGEVVAVRPDEETAKKAADYLNNRDGGNTPPAARPGDGEDGATSRLASAPDAA